MSPHPASQCPAPSKPRTTTNPFPFRQCEPKLRQTAEFQQHSVLDSIRLKEFCARSEELPKPAGGVLRLDLHHETRSGEFKEGIAPFDVDLKMKALLTGGTEVPLFELDCRLEANYRLAPDFRPSEEQLASFRRANVLFHCWPYLRELVHNSAWRMGLMLPPLPLLRVAPEPAGRSAAAPARKARKKTRHPAKRMA